MEPRCFAEVVRADAGGDADRLGPDLDAHHLALAVDVERPARIHVLEREAESDVLAQLRPPGRSVVEREEHARGADIARPTVRVIERDRKRYAVPRRRTSLALLCWHR